MHCAHTCCVYLAGWLICSESDPWIAVLNLLNQPAGVGREQFKFGFQNLTFKLFSALMTRMLRIQFVMYRIH